MPTYSYQCQSCKAEFDRVLRLAEFDEPQFCECGCEDPAKRVIAGSVGFVLRGDGWTGKNIRIKRQMAKRRGHRAGKERGQNMEARGVHLAPNVGGERVDSWADAQKLARSKGKDAGSYDTLVREEQQRGRV